MTTSGTFNFLSNRDQTIRLAMLFIGKLDEIETPTAQDITDCTLILNMLIKQLMGKTDYLVGLKIWKRKWGYLFLSNSTNKYTVGPNGIGWTNTFVRPLTTAISLSGSNQITVDSATGIAANYNIGILLDTGALQWTTVQLVAGTTITLNANLTAQASSGTQVYCFQTAAQQPLSIETVVLRDQFNEDIPLRILRTVQDYANLPSKTDVQNISDPTAIYYEFQLTDSNLYTDCGAANDLRKYLVISYQEPVQDITNPTDNFEYPQEFMLPFAWLLAKQIAPMYNMPWTPVMDANLTQAIMVAGHKDAEVSTMYFQPGAED
jgi:hypothetical protein